MAIFNPNMVRALRMAASRCSAFAARGSYQYLPVTGLGQVRSRDDCRPPLETAEQANRTVNGQDQ